MLKHISSKVKQTWINYRYQHHLQRSRFQMQLEDLPPGLFEHWQQSAPQEFHGIPTDAIFFVRAAEGLMMFFDVVSHSDRSCGLPSKAADSVWHAWLSLPHAEPQGLQIESFCLRHFGREIPHLEAERMPVVMSDAIANTLVSARIRTGHDPAGAYLPLLFSLDRRLKMPEGYAYRVKDYAVAYQDMDRKGRAIGNLSFPPSLDPFYLLSVGLISQMAFDAYRTEKIRREASASSGSACGSTSSCDASGDGCADGGGCGSSCGGGCGS
jgi:hypothetical protein